MSGERIDWSVRGGRKQLLIKQHAPEILECYRERGFTATMVRYHLLSDTLVRFLRRYGDAAQWRQDDRDRAVILAQISREEARQAMREVRQLKRSFETFSTAVASDVSERLLLPLERLLGYVIRVPEGLAEEDRNPLLIRDLLGEPENEEDEK